MLTRITVSPLKREEQESPEMIEKIVSFTKEMEGTIINYCHLTVSRTEIKIYDDPYASLFEDDELPMDDKPPMDTTYYTDHPYTEDSDNLIGSKIPLQCQGEIQQGYVFCRKRYSSGMLIMIHHLNPIMDSCEYQVQFPYSTYMDYSVNFLLEIYTHKLI